MKYDNLTRKTVFDFTNDDRLLKKLFPNYTGNNKNEIAEMLLSDSTMNGFYLFSIAEYEQNNEMMRAIERQFDMKAISGYDPD